MNNSEFYSDTRVSPGVKLTLKVACWILWLMAVQQCAQLYFRPIFLFDIPIAIILLIIAATFHLVYLRASKNGFGKNFRVKSAKQ